MSNEQQNIKVGDMVEVVGGVRAPALGSRHRVIGVNTDGDLIVLEGFSLQWFHISRFRRVEATPAVTRALLERIMAECPHAGAALRARYADRLPVAPYWPNLPVGTCFFFTGQRKNLLADGEAIRPFAITVGDPTPGAKATGYLWVTATAPYKLTDRTLDHVTLGRAEADPSQEVLR